VHCDQIGRYLSDYATGRLPGFKAAWVSQHLAGCETCQKLVEEAGRGRRECLGPAPVAAAAEPLFPPGSPLSEAVQRPVPPGVRRAVAASLVMLVLGAAWPVLRSFGRTGSGAGQVPAAPAAALRADHPLQFQSLGQSQGGVALWLDSVVEGRNGLLATFSFHGDNISVPGANDSWVEVRDAAGRRLSAWLPVVATDANGISVQVAFSLPADQNGFRVQFSGVTQNASTGWALQLPLPPERLQQLDMPLRGLPADARLKAYGMVGDLLQVEVLGPPPDGSDYPHLFLRDGDQNLFAPSAYTGPDATGELMLQFPVPKTLQMPIQLVGDGYIRNYLGPWTIEANVLK
jgi:hypothetical protein